MDPVRYAALQAIEEILERAVMPGDALEEAPLTRTSGTPERDRSFLRELVYGVLRYRDRLDWTLSPFLKKPQALPPGTLNNLRLALYQILFLRVPDHAAVHESVEIEKVQKASRGKAGNPALVNGVLRNVIRRKGEISLPSFEASPLEHITCVTSHPKWMAKRWIARFGPQEALRLAQANNEHPGITLRVDPLASSRQEVSCILDSMGIAHVPTRFSPHGIILPGHIPYPALAPLSGKAIVQDEAAQIAGLLVDPRPGDHILDACAAPGGKSLHLAALMANKGLVTAMDNSPLRIEKLKENLCAFPGRCIQTLVADALHPPFESACFDRILLDAPCSSTGIIRKNPDVKYRHNRKSLLAMQEKQLALLDALCVQVKNEGVLVYSVCSTEPEEGEEVITQFLNKHPDYSIIDTGKEAGKRFGMDLSALASKPGWYRTFPHLHRLEGEIEGGMDGFFIVALKKSLH